jgi:hypothetical protein
MVLLDPPERLQPKVALNLVRNLFGWGVSAFAGRIRVGVCSYGDLAAGEFVFFISKLPSGLALPIPSFFMLLLGGLGLQLLHVTPCFILQAAIIAYLCGISVEATLLPASSSLVKVDSGLSHVSIPRAPNSLGWEASRAAAPSLWL